MKCPTILHIAPTNTSGVPGQLVGAERKLGYTSRLVTLFADKRNYFQDICLDLPFIDFAPTRWMKKLVSDPRKIKVANKVTPPEHIPLTWQPHSLAEHILVRLRDALWRHKVERAIEVFYLDQFDVYQLDGGLGFYRHAAFVRKQKNLGKTIICCYMGSDLRTRGVIPDIDAFSDVNVTVEFDHLQWHPDIHHVGFPFDTTGYAMHVHHDNQKPVRIGHAPTNRAAKGSDVIIPVLRELEQKFDAEMVLIEGMPYQDALAIKQSCDIFVDQIGDLGYGINSLEALAMGIPAVSCLAPGFAEAYPAHPFIDVQADSIKEKLIRLVRNPDYRRQKGQQGKTWVEKHHKAREVVKKIHRLAKIDSE